MALLDAQRDFRPTTYMEWNRNANRTANWLASLGVKQGTLVGILSMNCVEYLDIWFACGKLGAIMQTLNWRLTAHELCGLLRDATPLLLIYGPDFVAQASALRELCIRNRALRGSRSCRQGLARRPGFCRPRRLFERSSTPRRTNLGLALGDLLHGRHHGPAQRRHTHPR